MSIWVRKFLAMSNHPAAHAARWMKRHVESISVPAPRALAVPILTVFQFVRLIWHETRRICIAEPLFKAYCAQYGRRMHTGIYIHWVQGKGRIVVGDDVLLDG